MTGESLCVASMFHSIQGEGTSAGKPTVFIRLAGCNLECSFCDTKWARGGGEELTIGEIVSKTLDFSCPNVAVTGGEPLYQENTILLLNRLIEKRLDLVIETNGSIDISAVPRPSLVVMDIKCPGSGMSGYNRLDNLAELAPGDEVKFVISSRDDYLFARNLVLEGDIPGDCPVLFSPAWGETKARTLAEWILSDRLNVRLNVQLHRYIWEEDGKEH